MSFVKFPINVKPSRVTVNLQHQHEIFQSPVTGIQQVAARGGAYWRWTIEYKDISLEERDIVQSFLMSCRGSLNHFKVSDFSNYSINGIASSWVDLYNGAGDFLEQNDINSFTVNNAVFNHRILSGGGLLMTRKIAGAVLTPYETNSTNSVEGGNTYILRIKSTNDDVLGSGLRLTAGSYYQLIYSPKLSSAGQLSAPVNVNTPSLLDRVSVRVDADSSFIGSQLQLYNLTFARAALVANSENLITQSNSFADANWAVGRGNLASSYDEGPSGATAYYGAAWKLFKTTQTNTRTILYQQVTKNQTQSIFTASIYAKADDLSELRLHLYNNGESDRVDAIFWLNSGTYSNLTAVGSFARPCAKIYHIANSWYRCSVSAMTNSLNSIGIMATPCSGTGFQFTGNGSHGVLIYGAQVNEHPYATRYIPTDSDSLNGSNWQTGANLAIAGLPVNTFIAAAGTKFEIITRYHSDVASQYEQSEFKRLTRDFYSTNDGLGNIYFDPPIRNAPQTTRSAIADNFFCETMHNAVIFDRPEMKARLLGNTVQYIEKPLQMTDITFDIVEDLTE